ncbi:hypothetical protein LRM64_19420 [Prescottella equi]|uniref:hypothetical protein n=1 Tax=Rhodococcus hoagii TaxID=43767 RepID=UPI0019DD07A2|nr:hypothetical protein [Prescottella equi]MBM4577773.1 hypothetical protein [Prescottella equi]MBM4580928.1 hypothetical protein [Prescottella equi]MBM4581001.1 hypothetical protein [Prescottella equi]MBM4707110.1 hypothetical protein [Prescottella equi]MCU7527401.1 hypothetical protein [Prescottella equi]
MNADENGSAASFFETLLDEAVGPFFVTLGDGTELVIEAPSSDDVAELDTTTSIHDLLDLMVGEDNADIIADAYARRPIGDLADLIDDIREHFALLVPPDPGWAYLVEEINRYGIAIDRDLFGMPGNARLYDWVRNHADLPWNHFLRMLPALPRNGWYETATRDDDERADQILAMEAAGKLPPPSKRPSLLGWTPEIDLLTAVVDGVRRIEHGVWGASPKFKGKGGKPPQALPRPQTARERAEERQVLREHDDIASQLLGKRYTRRYSNPRG